MKKMVTPLKAAAALTLLLFAAAPAMAMDPEIHEPGEWEGITLADGKISIGALVEAEATYEKQGDDDSTDLRLSTAELGLAADIADGVRGEVVLFWEQDEDVEIDAAYIELGGTEDIPVVLTVGRIYLPFGGFNSLMVSDPLTLELGETRKTAATLAYEYGPFTAVIGAFGSELDNVDHIENGVASLGITVADGIQFGVSVISDIGESGTFVDDINDLLAEEGDYDKTPAISAYALLEWNGLSLSAEYLGALDDMEWTAFEEEPAAMRPQAWFVDLGYAFNDSWSAALRYEGSKEFKGDEIPEHQFGGSIHWAVNEFVGVGLEYLYGTFDEEASEDADDRHLVTAKLSLAF